MNKAKNISLVFCILFSIHAYSQHSHQQELYQAFLSRNASKWEAATAKCEKTVDLNKTTDLLKLIHCYYGWTSELIDEKQYQKAEVNIEKVEKWLDKILEKEPNHAVATCYKGVFISYPIAYNKLKALSLGKQSLELIRKAYSLDPNNVQILFDNGNACYYAPKVFGGDKKAALKHFEKAISILEKQNNTTGNWMYIQMLMLEARCNDLLGNINEAKNGYEKTLKFEPNFKIVKEKYYPELLKKI